MNEDDEDAIVCYGSFWVISTLRGPRKDDLGFRPIALTAHMILPLSGLKIRDSDSTRNYIKQ